MAESTRSATAGEALLAEFLWSEEPPGNPRKGYRREAIETLRATGERLPFVVAVGNVALSNAWIAVYEREIAEYAREYADI